MHRPETLLFEESLWHDLSHSFSHKCPNHSAPLASPPHFQSSIPPEPLFSGSLRIVLKFFVLGIISASESDLCWFPPKRSQAVLTQSGKCAPVGLSGTPSAPKGLRKRWKFDDVITVSLGMQRDGLSAGTAMTLTWSHTL